ncbi:MAG: putative toxin-antitoxin system toxin component, PIN family [Verrucomicrobia bacterium]|nr:putative toxin-antitoxin system toxin component, PIN family [Verrucomicrobiota bacterium]
MPRQLLTEWEKRFASAVAEWPVECSVLLPRDEKDAKFLACALSAQADFLVTGDYDFTEARKIAQTKIVSVRQFHDWCAYLGKKTKVSMGRRKRRCLG